MWSVCAQQHHPPAAPPNLLFVEGQPVRRKKLKRKGAETACSRQKLKWASSVWKLHQDAIILNRESCKDTFSGKHKENMEMIIIGLV